MVGLFSLLAYLVIGKVVAALDGRGAASWERTAIATVGAISGAYIGHSLGFYVAFGEVPGFICSVAGSVLLLRVWQSRIVTAATRAGGPSFDSQPAAQVPEASPIPLRRAGSTDESQTLFGLLAEAFGWGTICAFPTAAAGLVGHLFGAYLYPQPYEQIPSDLLFVPLGMVVGFVAAAMARVAWRDWSRLAMVSFVGLVALVYAVLMFQYSRIHSQPAHITAVLEPATLEPIACSPDTCAGTDPPSQWYVTLPLRLKTSRLGATIDRIEITSNTDAQGPITPHPYTKEGAAEAARWRGPLVTLTGRRIPGPRHLVPGRDSTYSIVYGYHTRDGASRRTILISVYLTDAAGHDGYAGGTWKVR